MLPGDPAVLALGSEVTQQQIDDFREQYHLNEPIVKQYWIWITNALRGDFGISIAYKRSVIDCLAERLPRTVAIGLPALIISSVLGILIGIVSAVNRGKAVDKFLTFLVTLGIGTPTFWLGMIGILVYELKLGLLPLSGFVSAEPELRPVCSLFDNAGNRFVIHTSCIRCTPDTLKHARSN